MSNTVVAKLGGVVKRYGKILALDRFDLSVGQGELLAVLGPNGAGKSTAIALLLGLQTPDTGTATLFGSDPRTLASRRRVGAMMQEVGLAPELRVRELLDLTSSYYPRPLPLDALLATTHLGELEQRPYGKLSAGQKRQVQFAMAICGQPRLLFLDEPTVGLDVRARELLWAAVRKLVEAGTAVVLTTHYLEEAEALADRVAVLAKGQMIASGSVAEIRNLVAGKRIACTTTLSLAEVTSWAEVDSAVQDRQRLFITARDAELVVRRLLAADVGLCDLEIRRAGLAEAFTELTQEAA